MRCRSLLPAVLAVTCGAAELAPWTIWSDFETYMRQGWESYPLAQDAGYEPTLDPVQYQGRKALERHKCSESRRGVAFRIRAKGAGDCRLGRSASDVPLRCSFFKERLTLKSACLRTISLECSQSRSRTKAPGPKPRSFYPRLIRAEIRAVSITAIFPEAREGREERFLIDDVRLSAIHANRIFLSQPPQTFGTKIGGCTMCGELIAREGTTNRSSPASVKLFDPRTVGRGTALVPFVEADKPGMWRAELKSDNGSSHAAPAPESVRSKPGLLFDDLPPRAKSCSIFCASVLPSFGHRSHRARAEHSFLQRSLVTPGPAILFRLLAATF